MITKRKPPAAEIDSAEAELAVTAFKTRREIERYFSGNTIECLLCGRHFKRLQTHLAAKHDMTADEYKERFGLPWTRGLTSAASVANSGWTNERKARAQRLARQSRFFELAHMAPRREVAPFLKTEAIKHLGANAKGLGDKFDLRVRALVEKGLSIRAIARILKVAHSTILDRVHARASSRPNVSYLFLFGTFSDKSRGRGRKITIAVR
jgi:hypothetical protein